MDHASTEKKATAVESNKLGRNFLWMSWSGVISIANSVLVWMFMARVPRS